MNEKDIRQTTAEAAIQEGIQDKVRITLEKKPGGTTFTRHIEASDARAALIGLEILIAEYARIVGLQAAEVLSLLAVSLLAPALQKDAKDIKA